MHPLIKILLIIIALQLVQLGYLTWLTHRHHEALLHRPGLRTASLAPLVAIGLAGVVVMVALLLNLRILG